MTKGTYILNNKNVNKMNDKELTLLRNEFFGLVFQHYYLIPYLLVYDNLKFPLIYGKIKKRTIAERINKILIIIRI